MLSELYPISEGKIVIAYSGKDRSIGYLVLDPRTELSKHNRPVLEELRQISGRCVVKLDGGKEREVTLDEDSTIKIPPEQFHIHANPFSKPSYTLWIAHGDITEIIESIRKKKEM